MRITHADIDNLYQKLGVDNVVKEPRNILNTGSLDRELNTTYSAVAGNKRNLNLSSGVKMK